ncbi:ATP-binding protein [Pontibacter toksunensis]|uniref:histidine kinase n=1 Tax=Pontibacter toksunensis TaxID=1332631 RepID=A0ABW6C164_9BACT
MQPKKLLLENVWRLCLLLVFFQCLNSVSTFAQAVFPQHKALTDNHSGLPFIKNFNPKEYLHLTSSYEHTAIIQDNSGRILIGSHGGILVYNGSDWQFKKVPGKSIVWSLDKDATGRIFVGATDNLGYLATDDKGQSRFVSLLPYLPKNMPPLGEVWSSIVTPEGVFFKTNQYLMRWHKNRFKVWKAETALGFINWLNGKLYIQLHNKGLFELHNDKLREFSADTFFVHNRINFIHPLKSNNWLMGINNSVLYLFDGQSVTLVKSPAQDYLKKNTLFNSKLLSDGNIALATLKGGVIVVNQKGHIETILNKESGLATNTAYLLSTDRQGGLWISMEKGFSRVHYKSALSYFNERNGLIRQTNTLLQHKGMLYAGTTDGLFVLNEKSSLSTTANFSKVAGPSFSVWALQSYNKSLLIASEQGLLEQHQGKITSIPISSDPWDNYCQDIERSNIDSSVIYVASKGLYAFQRVGQEWKKTKLLPDIEENLFQVTESPNGDIWLPLKSGITRVRFPKKQAGTASGAYIQGATTSHYGGAAGVPAGATKLYMVGEQLIAQVGETDLRLYAYSEALDKFEPVQDLASRFGLLDEVVLPAMEYSKEEEVWLWTKKDQEQSWQLKLVRKQPGGTYKAQAFDLSGTTTPLRQFAYEQEQEAVWFGGLDGLVRLDRQKATDTAEPFPTLLERIILPTDSVLYAGATAPAHLPYQYNSLRFEVAAPSYNGSEENRFQFWLQGYDEDWSAWAKESSKAYAHVPEGTYNLHARSLNAKGQVGEEAIYTFTIQPPWYRTTIMYLFYFLSAGGAVFALVRWRSARLKSEKEQLEKLIELRTKEVATKNEQLSQQADALAAQTEKLRELDQVKSRFFANISHEFRTPLTIILNNLLDRLSYKASASEQTDVPIPVSDLKVMSRNAKRLLQLINQLLDLSKVESCRMLLEPQDGDLKQLLRLVHASFSSLADHQHIEFSLVLPDDALLCRFDGDKVEKILYNLLSNAFKFTPAHGTVQLKVTLLTDAALQPTPSMVQVVVQDSGHGLAPEQLSKVFDRFYQGEQHYPDAQGTGIGLALAKELVALHQGQLWAESHPGKGAAFILQLPFIPVSVDHIPASGNVTAKQSLDVIPDDVLPPELTQLPIDSVSVAAPHQEEAPLLLIVEDNSDLRSYMRRSLEGSYRVLESINGAEGLATAREVMPDLIISDWMMPEMDGLILCGQLKNDVRTSHIPIILLTALASTDAKLTGLETGADEYLTKPFDSTELQRRIQNLLENRRRLREHFSKQIHLEPTKIIVASVDEKFLRQVMQVVEEHLGDADFSVDEFSREIGLSRVHLHRKLKALTGQSPSDFIRVMRLKQAANLLDARAGNVAEIAYQVGFNNLSYFSKCFRAQFGVLPNEYASQQSAPLTG